VHEQGLTVRDVDLLQWFSMDGQERAEVSREVGHVVVSTTSLPINNAPELLMRYPIHCEHTCAMLVASFMEMFGDVALRFDLVNGQGREPLGDRRVSWRILLDPFLLFPTHPSNVPLEHGITNVHGHEATSTVRFREAVSE